MPTLTAQAHAARATRERRLLILLLLAVAGGLAWVRWESHREIVALERSRLLVQSRAIEQNLTRQFAGVRAALRGTRDDLVEWRPAVRAARARSQLQALSEAMPGTRALRWVDAQGRVLAASDSDPQLLKQGQQAWFDVVRLKPEAERLYVSRPYAIGNANGNGNGNGDVAMNLSVALFDAMGRFDGALTATLDSAYFDTLLGSVLYARDMRASIVHATGRLLVVKPSTAQVRGGLDVAQAGGLFSRHIAARSVESVFAGDNTLTPDEIRLAAQRTMQPPELQMDQPLVVGTSRDWDTILGAWTRLNPVFAALYAAFALAAWLALRAQQQRRLELAQRSARETAEAERLSLALGGGDLALWDADLLSGRGEVNQRWYAMLGLESGEVPTDHSGWEALIHPDDRPAVLAAHHAHLAGQTPAYEAQYRLRHRSGRWIWVLDRGRVVERDAQGQALRMVGTHMDISSRVEAEEALRRSEQSLATTLYSIGDAVIATDAQGRVTRMNATAERLTGWPAAEAVGVELRQLLRLHSTRTGQPGPDTLARVLAGGEVVDLSGDTMLVARDGVECPIAASAAPIRTADGGIAGVVLVFSDVTERQRAERELRLLEAAVSGLNDMVVITEATPVEEPGPRIVFVNEAFERHTGWQRAEVLGRSPRFLRHESSDAAELARVDAALARGETVHTELVNQTRDGRPYWIDITLTILQDASGQATHIVSVHRDITERRRAAAEVQRVQQELAATLAAVPDLLFDLDADGLIHGHHSPRADLLLMEAPQFIGRRADEVLPPAAAQVVYQALDAARRHGYSGGLQYELALPAGPHWFELSVACKETAPQEVPRFIALARDVTERREAEAQRQVLEGQLREAQKMESIGTLAGGIAHDFNNILAAILGNVALARGDLPADHAAQLSLEQIHKASQRARTLVQQILTFSRRQPNALRVQALQPVVHETLALLRATLPAAVRVDLQVAAEPLWMQADATQLQQVLMNLSTNAWHALPESGGRIGIGCEALASLPGPAPVPELVDQPLVHLWVSDNGSGIGAQALDRIFDPFFTTKPVGQGTGLGLSVVHGIVRSHGGVVRVDSQPGVGSTFHLYFPAQPPPTEPAASQEAAQALEREGRGQRLLYVDDDEVMLLMVERLLQRRGYDVAVSDQATRALALVAAMPGHFDLVISDFNMPEMSGLELARELLTLHPGLPVVISSGFVTDELRQRAGSLGVRALFNKEKTMEELPALVRRLLATG